MQNEEKTIQENYIYKGRILKLKNDTVSLPDGSTAKREIVEHSGGACVLCVDGDKILLVKQYRYAYKEEVLEVPAGKLEAGEDPSKAALRELAEECGVKAVTSEKLASIYPTPGYTNEVIHIYLVTKFEKCAQHLDVGEFLSYGWYEIEDVINMIEDGKIKDAKTIIAVYKYLLKNRQV